MLAGDDEDEAHEQRAYYEAHKTDLEGRQRQRAGDDADDPNIMTAAMKHRRYFIDAIFVRMASLSFSVQGAGLAGSARRLLPFDAAALWRLTNPLKSETIS